MIPFGFILRIINLNSSNASGSSLIVLHALCHIPHPAILCPAIIPDLTSVLFDGLRPSLLLNVCSRGGSVCAAGTSPSHQGFLYLSLKSPSLLYVPRPLQLVSPPPSVANVRISIDRYTRCVVIGAQSRPLKISINILMRK